MATSYGTLFDPWGWIMICIVCGCLIYIVCKDSCWSIGGYSVSVFVPGIQSEKHQLRCPLVLRDGSWYIVCGYLIPYPSINYIALGFVTVGSFSPKQGSLADFEIINHMGFANLRFYAFVD
ncbi:hypothetical protein BC941DRAFT_447247 [Chlamydoabsidia padenii]|nr:hypothetical protein BC941DRAFT_447247 [Chlamydoabsidia padenii]